MTIVILLLKLTYFMLPAYFANMAPVFAKYIFSRKVLTPIDLGAEVGGHPLFGKHKTFGGFIFGVFIGIATVYIQFLLYPHLKDFCLVDYSALWIQLGFLLGLGAITGDLVESFFKRRFNLKSGKPWLPYDELDFSIGALIFVSPVYFPGWANSGLILLISMLGDILVGWLGYLLHIRKKKDIVDIPGVIAKFFRR